MLNTFVFYRNYHNGKDFYFALIDTCKPFVLCIYGKLFQLMFMTMITKQILNQLKSIKDQYEVITRQSDTLPT